MVTDLRAAASLRAKAAVPGARPARGIRAAALALLLGLVIAAPSTAAQPRFRHLSLEHGLSHSSVYSLLQDRQGFVWIGTQAGLDRYDGYRILRNGQHPGEPRLLPTRDLGSVYQDAAGAMWIGTWGAGLFRWDPKSGDLRGYQHDPADPQSLTDSRIHAVAEDGRGNLWVATFRGLDRIELASLRLVHWQGGDLPGAPAGATAALAAARAWSLAPRPDGKLWVGTNSGLYLVDPARGVERVLRHDPGAADSLPGNEIRTLLLDRSGRLWVGTDGGVALLTAPDQPLTRLNLPGILPDSPPEQHGINALFEDSRGELWIGSRRTGLYRLRQPAHPEVVDRYMHDPLDATSLGHEDVRAITEDASGLIWVGTRGGGVSILDPRPPRMLKVLDEQVRTLIVDRAGTLWAGTLDGLVRIDPDGTTTRLRHVDGDPTSLPDNIVQSLLEDRSGRLWVGTFHGIAELERSSGAFRPEPGPQGVLADKSVEGIVESRDGALWLGTRQGVFRRDASGSWSQWHTAPAAGAGTAAATTARALSDDFVRSLIEDREGRIWVGTDVGGLNRIDRDGTVRVFRHRDDDPGSISDDRVHSIWEGDDGSLWAGTAFGLNRLRPGAKGFDHLFEDQGLPSSTVLGILGDRQGMLWISSHGGLTRLDPRSAPGQAGRMHTFGASDGLQSLIFTTGAVFRAADGELLFGGRKGLNRFRPEAIAPHSQPPRLVLTDLTVFNQRPQLARSLGFLPRLDLTYRDSFFTVEFAALDFVDPARNEYAYKLEGFDADWVPIGTRHWASFTRVPPGDYTLRIKAANSDGVWNEEGLQLPVHISPPFWRTWWFETLAALAVAALLLAGHRARLHAVRRHNLELERLVAVRTAEAEARRREAEAQRRRLELTNDLVKLINEETELPDLLRAILEGVSFFAAAERGEALVLGSDELFHLTASTSVSVAVREPLAVSRDEIERGYLGATREVSAGVFLGPPSPSRVLDHEVRRDGAPAAVLALRIEVDAEVAGYLLLAHGKDAAAFSALDVAALEDLRDHVASAFLKGRMLERLRFANDKKSEFLGIAAHDLRSPLGGILSTVDLLLRLLGEERVDAALWRRFLGNVRATAEHMRALVTDLLDVTAIESGRVKVEPRREKLRELVAEWTPLHQRIAEDKGIALEVVEPPPEWEVVVDRGRMGEVVDNLLSNALKFTPRGGSVKLFCEKNAHEATVCISDTGQGLPAEDLRRVFTGGKLSARPTAGESSSGLGLLIVKKLVELHGGRVFVESRQGKGSTFGFTVPLAA